MMIGILRAYLFIALGVIGFFLVVCCTAFGLTVSFNNPIISALGGLAAGLSITYLFLRRLNVSFIVATATAIGGLLLPWFVSLRGSGPFASVDGILLSSVVTFVCTIIGVLMLPKA